MKNTMDNLKYFPALLRELTGISESAENAEVLQFHQEGFLDRIIRITKDKEAALRDSRKEKAPKKVLDFEYDESLFAEPRNTTGLPGEIIKLKVKFQVSELLRGIISYHQGVWDEFQEKAKPFVNIDHPLRREMGRLLAFRPNLIKNELQVDSPEGQLLKLPNYDADELYMEEQLSLFPEFDVDVEVSAIREFGFNEELCEPETEVETAQISIAEYEASVERGDNFKKIEVYEDLLRRLEVNLSSYDGLIKECYVSIGILQNLIDSGRVSKYDPVLYALRNDPGKLKLRLERMIGLHDNTIIRLKKRKVSDVELLTKVEALLNILEQTDECVFDEGIPEEFWERVM